MNTDKRPFFIWLALLLAEVGVYFLHLLDKARDGVSDWNTLLTPTEILPFIAYSLTILIVAVIIAKLKDKEHRNLLVKKILFFLLLPILPLWIHAHTCTGKFCDLAALGIMYTLGVAVIIFVLGYAMGIYFSRWNVKLIISLVLIEIVALVSIGVVTAHFFDKNVQFEARTASLVAESQKATEPVDIGRTCDAIPKYRDDTCWERALKLYPNTDVCAWSKSTPSKSHCLFYEGLRYRGNLEYGCEENDSLTSYKKKDDPGENSRLLQCWADKAKIYPELDICQWTYEWNMPKCAAYFKTTSR